MTILKKYYKYIFLLIISSLYSPLTFAKYNATSELRNNYYLGSQIGFNFSKMSVYVFGQGGTSDRHGTTSQELYMGHFLYKNSALELGLGNYFSSLGLGGRIGLKQFFPISNKWTFSIQGGGQYIYSIFDDGLYGPYAGAGIEYSLNKNISFSLNLMDTYQFNKINLEINSVNIGNELEGNFFSGFLGFVYYLNN